MNKNDIWVFLLPLLPETTRTAQKINTRLAIYLIAPSKRINSQGTFKKDKFHPKVVDLGLYEK
jgi:hypothetical protein